MFWYKITIILQFITLAIKFVFDYVDWQSNFCI